MAVVGVDDDRRAPERQARGEPAQDPRLGGVGVDDVGPEAPDMADQRRERSQVIERARHRAEAWDLAHVQTALAGPGLKRPLPRPGLADQQHALVLVGVQPLVQDHHVMGRPTHVEPRDDPQHPDAGVPRGVRGAGRAHRDVHLASVPCSPGAPG